MKRSPVPFAPTAASVVALLVLAALGLVLGPGAALAQPEIAPETAASPENVAGPEARTASGFDNASLRATVGSSVSNLSASAERGRYLVERVAMCGHCHTPRDDRGELRPSQWLHGAPVPLSTPAGYAEKWTYKAPRIAGLPQYETDADFVKLLTTGINRDGKEPMAPMPPYRMSEEDAQAIADYLRSLP